MKSAIRLAFLFFPVVMSSEFANAQVGTVEEVIQAAKAEQEQEPAYIQELMVQLSTSLQVFAQRHQIFIENEGQSSNMLDHAIKWYDKIIMSGRIQSYERRFAWWITMRAVINVAYKAALETAQKAAMEAAGDGARCDANDAAENGIMNAGRVALGDADLDDAYYIARDVAYYDVSNAAREAIGYGLIDGASNDEIGRIAWRVAQWAVLNWFLQNIDAVLKRVYFYEAYFRKPYSRFDLRGKNPFEFDHKLVKFLDKRFKSLEPKQMLFLAPWLLRIVSKDKVPQLGHSMFNSIREQ